MNETLSSNPSPGDECLTRLIFLKHALAGDLESTELIDQLIKRVPTIDWDNPEFIKFTEEMRVGTPELSTEQKADPGLSLMALIHAQGELLACHSEDNAVRIAETKALWASLKAYSGQVKITNDLVSRLLRFADRAMEIHSKMYTQLELLGADISTYQLPPI